MDGWWIASASVVLAVAVAGCLYHVVIRPWHLRWGTIGDEAIRPLPGDDFAPGAQVPITHAIAINAQARDIWPWLVQMGQRRAGFYSYTWLENLVGCQIRNADRIVPEWQNLAEGDAIWLHPRTPPLTVVGLEPARALVLGGRMGETATGPEGEQLTWPADVLAWSWAFVLDPQSESQTRLLARARGHRHHTWRTKLSEYAFGEPVHFIMEQKMLRSIKRRAEART